MSTSIRSFRPTRRAALIAAAIVLAAASGANARSGPSASGNGSHSEAGHRASLASTSRVMSPPIIAMKPGQKHHHHAHIRFFNDWYWANACARYPARSEEAKRRIDPRWYGLARCRVIDEPVAY